jgi:hypothetical protein
MEEVDEHEFLFGRQGGADAHRPVVEAAAVEGNLLDPLGGLERAGGPLGVGTSVAHVSKSAASASDSMITVAYSQHSTSHS